MATPDFRVVSTPDGDAVTYTCGCSCTPTARPGPDGRAGHETCCCGKVHFVGEKAASHLMSYLEVRKTVRKREPSYETGRTRIMLDGFERDVAWAFPIE